MATHVNSHIVSIHRLGTFLSRAQAKTSDTFFSSNKEGIGGYFEKQTSGRIGSGLTLEEEKILMPHLIDLPPEDRDFKKKVTEFFNDINTDVPAEHGVELEIGLLKDNNQPISESNLPISIMDYIRYRHAKGHPYVVESKEQGDGNLTKRFYIFDKEALQNKKQIFNKERDAANEIYLKIIKEPDMIDQMLALMGQDIRVYNVKNGEDLKKEKLRELSETKPKDFKAVYETGDLEVRAWINNMVLTKVLKQVGKRIFNPEDEGPTAEIGNSMDEAIMFFKDEDNSSIVTTLKARLQEAMSNAPEIQSRKTIVA